MKVFMKWNFVPIFNSITSEYVQNSDEWLLQFIPGHLYIGRRNERACTDRCVMRKKTGASTILKEIEGKRDFELFNLYGHFSQSFWCENDLNVKIVKAFLWLKGLCAVMVK